ncbi:hypothetical protein QY917_01035 [Diaphorobacter sp. C33]|uniref:Immunity protein 50 of polymorphic toxin system n=2 Tax=Diaphorobacter TaxID=238749 RepID=A0AAX1WZI3_9BURK|nr:MULTISPECIES: hypothetical protein [unclassified Diaphorobacter]MBV2218569.1 hypothetical protein [Diaphorobacter sp.]ROR50861.1 hypothetical protein EDC60_0622 [Diaphorobacter nitroreducens]WKK89782.1 hypothetical protein QY917_01035 [Diaphorobacter sp. C33]
MTLHFLDFDYSEDEEGTGTWDAMASVPTDRLPELLAEITALLDWAHTEFGALRGPVETGGLWDYDLQCERDGLPLLALGFDIHERQIHPRPQSQPQAWVTLTLSLSGGPAFAAAFVDRFGAT